MFVPPTFNDFDDYERWSKDVYIWQSVTDIEACKQGGALYLSLDGKIREYCSSIPLNRIMSKDGVDLILQKLKGQCKREGDGGGKQIEDDVFAHYESFSTFTKPSFMNMVNYVNEFERLYNNIKHKGVHLPDDVLVYHLLNSASVSDEKKNLWKSILPEQRLLEIKNQVKNIFNYQQEEELRRLRDFEDIQLSEMTENNKQLSLSKLDPAPRTFLKQRSNKRKENGSSQRRRRKKTVSSLESMSDSCASSGGQLLSETFNSAVLDSGCTTTVCGKVWLECYISTLSNEDQTKIVEKPTDIRFKFADGKTLKSQRKLLLPAHIGSVQVMIETDVIDSNIPLLLSKESLKGANTTIDFSNEQVVMLEQTLKLKFTSSGHCCIPIVPPHDSHTSMVPEAYMKCNVDKRVLASKIHTQFNHAASEAVIESLKDAGLDDEEFFSLLSEAESRCRSCRGAKKQKLRPVVHFALAKEFNKVVALDVIEYKGVHLLHVIDHSTRLSMCAVLHHFHEEVIINKFNVFWVKIFKTPQKIVSHDSRFETHFLDSLSLHFDTEVVETDVDSNIIHSNTALVLSILKKIEEETSYPLELAVTWAVSAKNTLKNVYGFAPNQLVFGKEMNFSLQPHSTWDGRGNISKKIVDTHLQLLINARESFLEKGSFLMMAKEASVDQGMNGNDKVDSYGEAEKEKSDSFTGILTESWSFSEGETERADPKSWNFTECNMEQMKTESWSFTESENDVCYHENNVDYEDRDTEIDTVSDFDDETVIWSDHVNHTSSITTFSHTND